ncbi:hypothetical protein CVT26_011004 [Gymnopilus dilepis]|uniref:Protein kinase domain-containing protein n=1 Tax=Gymnopilus dilepis TaxID=231916 RepID=A0A409VY92_9AGAR|nr:hypothetical protein CVT26_011004 [Gymnopilus dilepis]
MSHLEDEGLKAIEEDSTNNMKKLPHLRNSDIILNRYKLLEKIGSGTSGTVWRTQDLQRPNSVLALKLMHHPGRNTRVYRTRNAEKIIRSSPSADKRLFTGVCGTSVYLNHRCLIFPLHGMSLRSVLNRPQFLPLPTTHFKGIIWQIFKAIAFMKSLGIAHTDLKPENIVLVEDTVTYLRTINTKNEFFDKPVFRNFEIKIIDLENSTIHPQCRKNMAGTVCYRAPEIYSDMIQFSDPSSNHHTLQKTDAILQHEQDLFIMQRHAEISKMDISTLNSIMTFNSSSIHSHSTSHAAYPIKMYRTPSTISQPQVDVRSNNQIPSKHTTNQIPSLVHQSLYSGVYTLDTEPQMMQVTETNTGSRQNTDASEQNSNRVASSSLSHYRPHCFRDEETVVTKPTSFMSLPQLSHPTLTNSTTPIDTQASSIEPSYSINLAYEGKSHVVRAHTGLIKAESCRPIPNISQAFKPLYSYKLQ